MNREEIYNELCLTYDELQAYLLKKYGGAQYDYFPTPECKAKNKKVSRTKEGLYCHHMDEDKGGNLGNPPQAKMQPFEWQKKERLVYCNVLEHLILHFKIAVLRQKDLFKEPKDILDFFTTGGIYMICQEINDMFMNDGTSLAWKKRCYEEIKENYCDYIALIKSLLLYIKNDYIGKKEESEFLKVGSFVHFSDCDCEILKISNKKNVVLLRLPNGEEKTINSYCAMSQFQYLDATDMVTRKMASGYDDFYGKIYNDFISYENKSVINEYSLALKCDYNGYGYPQYADILLSSEYGSKNADEYISKGLPMYCEAKCSLDDKVPVFWTGSKIPRKAVDSFYVLRIKTMFDIKRGQTPFVRYREYDYFRRGLIEDMSETHNLKDYGWIILETSDLCSKKTGKRYSKYKDFNGNIVDATVILTLGKEDYLLFKEIYDIRYLEVLDGCYFK